MNPRAIKRGRPWRRARIAALHRAGFRCELGAPGCDTPPTQVHHLIRLADGGTNRPDNLAATCRAHHREAHGGPDTTTPRPPRDLDWERLIDELRP